MEFEKIWNAHYPALKNFVSVKVPQQEVDDILQTVSLELHKNIQNGKEIRNPKNWLFQVSRNTIADHFKKQYKSNASELNFAHTEQEDFEDCICDIVEPIIKGLLPEKYSTPLILSDLYNIPQKEIANQLNLSYENVKSRILRARKKIKEIALQSTDLEYNTKGEVIGAKLKPNHNFPLELVKIIKKFEVEI